MKAAIAWIKKWWTSLVVAAGALAVALWYRKRALTAEQRQRIAELTVKAKQHEAVRTHLLEQADKDEEAIKAVDAELSTLRREELAVTEKVEGMSDDEILSRLRKRY